MIGFRGILSKFVALTWPNNLTDPALGCGCPPWRIAHLAGCNPDFNVHIQSHQTAPSAPHASHSFFALIIWI